MLSNQVKNTIRNIPDFPKKGIIFRDISPVLKDATLCKAIVQNIKGRYSHQPPDVVSGIESRGFLFGILLAEAFGVPFVLVRKKGKLPYKTIAQTYDLEYGKASIEMHIDAIKPGQKVMIHDDLLATGGTAQGAAQLVQKLKGEIHSFTFLVELDALQGRSPLEKYKVDIHSLVHY